MSEWRKDGFGRPNHALYVGKLYAGSINQWRGQWRGWFMSDDEGNETGWFATADEARASVEAALAAALDEVFSAPVIDETRPPDAHR